MTAFIDPRHIVLLIATILAGLSAGFFYTYETSVTLALADVDDSTYVKTFQAINDSIRNPAFGLMFFGTIPAMALAIAFNWTTVNHFGRLLFVVAGALLLVTLLITGRGNVPLNNDLADVSNITEATAASARAAFETDWNSLNLIRTFTSVSSFLCLSTAMLVTAQSSVN